MVPGNSDSVTKKLKKAAAVGCHVTDIVSLYNDKSRRYGKNDIVLDNSFDIDSSSIKPGVCIVRFLVAFSKDVRVPVEYVDDS
mmetsp:Transcript_26136/g.38707  ORF Transcript_26136/g.38707 Transcript_26136/m.38707 type:complete len:83 (+) Transcript_26136:540-788(+)